LLCTLHIDMYLCVCIIVYGCWILSCLILPCKSEFIPIQIFGVKVVFHSLDGLRFLFLNGLVVNLSRFGI